MAEQQKLTEEEQQALDKVMDSVIDTARKNGLKLMGIDSSAINVRKALVDWIVDARNYRD